MANLLTVFTVLVLAGPGCSAPPPRPQPVRIRIGTFEVGGIYHALGTAMASLFTRRIPGLQASALATVGSVYNVQQVEHGEVDLGFTFGNVAYQAYQRGTATDPTPYRRLRGVAVLYLGAVQLITPRRSGILTVGDLRGRSVGTGSLGSGSEVVARLVLDAYGLKPGDLRTVPLSQEEVGLGMEHGTVDAGFVVTSYPYPSIAATNRALGIRLIPIDGKVVSRIRALYPFIRPTVVPAGTYQGQHEDVKTLGVDNLLVCREDLDEELVYRLTKTFFESLAELAAVHVAALTIDPDTASATPIPLHAGAARYYRERELLQ